MGLFSKVGGGIKRVLQRTGSIVKEGIKRAAPVVLNLAQKGTSLLSHAPGMIGTVAGLANKGINMVKGVVDNIPNSAARDKINSVLNQGQSAVNRGEDKAKQITSTITKHATPILSTTANLAQQANRMVNR